MAHPTIPTELVPRVLALKDWIGEWWPNYWSSNLVEELLRDKLKSGLATLPNTEATAYDLLCKSCERALRSRMYEVVYGFTGDWKPCVAVERIGGGDNDHIDPCDLTCLVTLCEYAKKTDERNAELAKERA